MTSHQLAVRHDRRATLCRALLGCVSLLGACSHEAEPAPPSSEAAGRPALSESDVDQLRALGYAGYADATVDPDVGPVVFLDASRSEPGYNLFSNRMLSSAQIMDAEGRILHTWSRPKHRHWSNCELLPGGDLLVLGSRFAAESEGSFERYIMRLDWDGELLWKVDMEAHHDVELGPDGRLATLTMGSRRIPVVNPEVDVRDNGVAILSGDGDVLAEYSLFDMLAANPDVFRFQAVGEMVLQGKPVIDLLHANSVEYVRANAHEQRHPLYRPGTLIVSFRHQDTIAAFDLERESVVWAWGQDDISGPHDATMLENGHILLFDNGLEREWSRVLEIEPIEGRIVWEYRAPNPKDFYTASRGSNQRLANGNTLVANSDSGEAFEVTPEGEIVWRFLNPNAGEGGKRATIVRMRRYPNDVLGPLLR